MLKLLKSGGRFAGDIFTRGFEREAGVKVNLGDVVGRLGMDAVFGGMTAMNTPGTALDKTIAGTATTLGGGLGGAVLAGVMPKGIRHNPHARSIIELAGGIGGDMLGMATGDAILRMKSPDGMSERDRQMKAADDAYRAQIERDLMTKMQQGGY
tara:strand:- start:5561 stop:6022 length:462 start_codon:yes stop_codon:yes gene_type:complete